MAQACPVQLLPTPSVPPTGLDGWADAIGQALDLGARMVSLFARPDGASSVLACAVLQQPDALRKLASVFEARGQLGQPGQRPKAGASF